VRMMGLTNSLSYKTSYSALGLEKRGGYSVRLGLEALPETHAIQHNDETVYSNSVVAGKTIKAEHRKIW